MKTYADTRVSFKDESGDLTTLPEKRFEKLASKPDPTKIQTFTAYETENDSDIMTLVPGEAERVNIFNRGLALKQQNEMRSLMLDDSWQAVEGAYDLAAACAEATERRAATPIDKAKKIFASLKPEEIAAILAEFGAAAAASA